MDYKKAFYGLVIIVIIAVTAAALLGNNPANKNQTPSSSSSAGQGTDLNYANQGLTQFPKDALSHTDAVSLDLSGNDLTGALPAEIRKLANLQTLDISNNRMTGIPAEIGQLKNLKTLNYSNNQITGLPMEIGNLTQLQTLDLRGNPNISQQDLSKIRAKLTNTDIRL